MQHPPYLLTEQTRAIALIAIQTRCTNRNWTLLAAHIRTNHLHAIIDAEARPKES